MGGAGYKPGHLGEAILCWKTQEHHMMQGTITDDVSDGSRWSTVC